MNSPHLEPDRHIPADVRAGIAAQLADFYAKGTATPFSLMRHLGAIAAGRLPDGREAEATQETALRLDQRWDPHRAWIGLRDLSARTMASTPGSTGGYLVGSEVGAAVDVLRPWSVAARAGAQTLADLRHNVTLPRVTTATAAGWFDETGNAPSEPPLTLGNVSLSPKTAIALVHVPLQLLRQGPAVEPFVRSMVMAAVAELLDRAFFAGAGAAAPLGLLATTGIGTQSGTSLAHAGLLTMKKLVLTAGAHEDALAIVVPPAVGEVLAARERSTNSGRYLLDDGRALGHPAYSTQNAAAGSLVLGDFSQAVIGIFGPGVRIDIDPSQNFNSAGLVMRVLLMADVAFPRPEAFAVASSVT